MAPREWTVSVVIPAFKAATTIGRAVESVLTQTCPVHEIIVVDDGGFDDIGRVLAPYADRVILLRTEHGGASRARNVGIERSSGELIAFLDADDYWEPEKIERHVGLYRAYPDLGLSFSDLYRERPGVEGRLHVRKQVDAFLRGRPSRVSGAAAFELAALVCTDTVVVPRSVLGAQRFCPDLSTGEDRDLWVRLILPAPVCHIAEPLATAVLEQRSLSRTNVDGDCSNMLRVVHRHAALLGIAGVRRWEARVYRRWACEHLDERRPVAALAPALSCLRRQPFSLDSWWLAAKSLMLAPTGMLRRWDHRANKRTTT